MSSRKSKKATASAAPASKPAKPPAENSAAALPTAKPPKPSAAKRKSEPRAGGLSAAHQVLSAAKEPMNVRDITKAAIDKGLWAPGGKTPWSTLAAAIGREIKDKGKQSRFKKTDRGLFAASGGKA